jgi:cobalt-zinc-cadmium efflux system outer membrane protein
MTMTLVRAAGVLVAVCGAASAQVAPVQQPPVSLAALEQMALGNNPTLAHAAAAVDAARGRAQQAGLFPNPIVGYSGEEIRPGAVIRGGEHGMFVEQTVPLGGKRRLRREMFTREVTQAEALVDVQRQRVLTNVRVLFYETLAAERRMDVRERLAQIAAEAVSVSRQLYNVGVADRPDVLQAEIEAHQARLAREEAANRHHRARQRLAAAVGVPRLSVQRLAADFEAPLPELEREAIREKLLRDSPELRAAQVGVERGEAALRRARKETAPDLFLRGGPMYNRELLERGPEGPRAVGWEASLEVGVTVPLFNRNQGGTAAAAAGLVQSRQAVGRLQLDLESRLADTFQEYLTALRGAAVYRTEVLPRAEEAYALNLARYREMAAAYPLVLTAQRTLAEVTEQYIQSVERTWISASLLQGFLLTDALQPPESIGTDSLDSGDRYE